MEKFWWQKGDKNLNCIQAQKSLVMIKHATKALKADPWWDPIRAKRCAHEN